MHTVPSAFLQAPLLSRTFQASPVSGPLHMLIFCLPTQPPFTFTHPHPTSPSGLSLQATSIWKPSFMLLGGSSSAPHILSAPSIEAPPPLTVTSWLARLSWLFSALWTRCPGECEWKKCEPSRWAGYMGWAPMAGSLLPSVPRPPDHPSLSELPRLFPPRPRPQSPSPALTCSLAFPWSTGCGKAISSLCRSQAVNLHVGEDRPCLSSRAHGETDTRVRSPPTADSKPTGRQTRTQDSGPKDCCPPPWPP